MLGDALPSFATVADFIRAATPSEPAFCYWPGIVRAQAARFVERFPGRTLFAVKCNPDRHMLAWLHDGGVRHFDTASLAEIELVHDLFPDATCYFNHPVKSREALRFAHDMHGVRDFVVDHDGEFDKLLETLGSEILVEVRLGVDNPDAGYRFSSKFGAEPHAAVRLLKRIDAAGANTALSFHVGGQCRRPGAFSDAMIVAKQVVDEAQAPVRYLNVGGGFPADYDGALPPIDAYFDAVREAYRRFDGWKTVPLYAEPGRALVAGGMGILVQVHLRKNNGLYINDGVFGSLSELRDMQRSPPVIAYGRNRVLRGEPVPFTVFGPTCDPLDELPAPFTLPDDTEEGDWILIERMGAYSSALLSDFNGFGRRTRVVIEQEPGGTFE
jgi:ornithine decarboxylase